MSKGCGCWSWRCLFNVLNGLEARPEGRGQTTHTSTTLCLKDHLSQSTVDWPPEVHKQSHKKHTAITTPKRNQCIHKNSPTPTHMAAHITTCMGGATPPPHIRCTIVILPLAQAATQFPWCILPH